MRTFFLAALLAVLVPLGPLRAADSDAVLERLQGKVMVLHVGAKKFVRASQGEGLFFGESVQTLKGAAAQVVFPTGTAVLVKEKSKFVIGGEPGHTWLSFPKGEFLIGLKQKLAPGQSFRVITPAAVAAVRGTLFWGRSDDQQDSTYAAFENRIEISAKGRKITLEPGRTVKIPFGEAPGQPEPSKIPLSYVQTFAVDGTLQGLDALLPSSKP